MKCKTTVFEYLSLFVLMVALTGMDVTAQAGNQAQEKATAKPIVTIRIDEKPPASGIMISSGSTVSTVKGSRTLVNLGQLGRVEVLRNSRIKISFDDVSITSSLYAGTVRIATPDGVSASISTTDGDVVVSRNGAANAFTIDTECGNTVVTVKKGLVELHASGEVRKIAAGSQGSLGTPQAGCNRKSSP